MEELNVGKINIPKDWKASHWKEKHSSTLKNSTLERNTFLNTEKHHIGKKKIMSNIYLIKEDLCSSQLFD